MRRSFAVAVGLAMATAPLTTPGIAGADPGPWPSGYGQPIEIVIQRALSQRGVPYVYGGGNAFGPTNGIRQSAAPGTGGFPGAGTATLPGLRPAPGLGTAPTIGTPPTIGTVPGATGGTDPAPGRTVGFDSSGLVQYAFAGAGIKMPRTSGQQCSVGRKVLPAQARRGDLICYGPGGSQSVALFLGNGQMIEATEPVVTVSAARTSNMAPYLTRIIAS